VGDTKSEEDMLMRARGLLVVLPLAVVLASTLLAGASPDGREPLTPAQRAAIEKAVTETHDQILQAARALKADANLEFMLDTDRGALVSGGRIFLTRAEATDAFRGAYAGLKSQEITIVQRHVNVLSPTIALLVAEVQGVATTLDDRTLSGRSAQTVVFVLADGRWKVVHAHQSALRP
jgi:ketosteroid isomerase-like protein